MYKVSRSSIRTRRVKVRGKPGQYGYEFKQLRPEHVNGKKPRGWNIAKSDYRVTVKLAYLLVQYPGVRGAKVRHGIEKRPHRFTVKGAVYSHRNVKKSEWLEHKVNSIIAGAIDLWVAQDLDGWLDNDLTIKAEYYPSKNEMIITRVG